MSQKRSIPRTCEQCGTTFLAFPAEVKRSNPKYCSRKCRDLGARRRIRRTCEQCDKEFLALPATVKKGFAHYCSVQCSAKAHAGRHRVRWIAASGYVWIREPDGRTYMEHRYVMEQHLGRPLRDDEVVHHIRPGKEAKSDNSLENLQVMSKSEHSRMHRTRAEGRWAIHYERCTRCGGTDSRHNGRGLCRRCYYAK